MKMVRLPEGGRIQVELDPEQVEVYVRAAIDREVRAHVEKSLPTYAVRDMLRARRLPRCGLTVLPVPSA